MFGIEKVKEDIDHGPEGSDSIPVTTVFTGTSREFIIFWMDRQFHKKPAYIECRDPRSPYKTEKGIHIGTTLATLVHKNGRPIEFYGLGWDYGGNISSFNMGKLDKLHINYSIGAKEGIPEKLTGDVKLSTDMPSVKKNLTKLFVNKIALSFE
jgi:hypothetical protein